MPFAVLFLRSQLPNFSDAMILTPCPESRGISPRGRPVFLAVPSSDRFYDFSN